MEIIRLENGSIKVIETILGRQYIILYNSNGEFIKFLSDVFEPWNNKHLLTIISDYKNNQIDHPIIKEIINKTVNLFNVVKENEREKIDNEQKIQMLSSENAELIENIKNEKEKVEASENITRQAIKTTGGILDKARFQEIKENSMKTAFKLFGGKMPILFKNEDFDKNVDEFMNKLLITANNECLKSTLKENEIDNLIKTLLDKVKGGKDEDFDYVIIINDVLKDKDEETKNKIRDLISNMFYERGDLEPLQKEIKTNNIDFDNVWFENIKKNNEFLTPIINMLSSKNSLEKAKETVLKDRHEEIKQNEFKRKAFCLNKYKKILEKDKLIQLIIFIFSVIISIISIIVVIVKSSKINVPFNSSEF